MAEDPRTSLILPAYVPNRELLEMTKRCIASLKETAKCQLIVIENGSRVLDVSGGRPANVYLQYEEPLGYARAANIGLAVARHDWLCVVNTDIEFTESGWLERFRADYLETPGGILSAMDDGREGIVHDESWFSCWLTHRDVIREVGYFDESLAYRFHDQDYAIRVKRAGYEVMRDGHVRVKHINSATYDTMDRDNDRAEEAAMVRRWRARDFREWLELGRPEPA